MIFGRKLDKKTICQRLTPQAQKLRSEMEVTCYSYEGVDAIKAALRKGLEHSTEQVPVCFSSFFRQVNFSSDQNYSHCAANFCHDHYDKWQKSWCRKNERSDGYVLELGHFFERFLESIKNEIERLGGRFEIKKTVETVDPEAKEPVPGSEENQENEEVPFG